MIVLTVTYTTGAKVAAFLQVTAFSTSTTPTLAQVEDLINRAEDSIDRITGHAWRSRNSYDTSDTNDYEYHDMLNGYETGLGIPVFLKRRHVRSIVTFEVWDGSAWANWLTSKTEGRANDYFIDYRQGKLYIRTGIIRYGRDSVRIRYTYGEQTVDKGIEDICTKMAAIDLASSDDRSVMLPEGADNIGLKDKAEMWRQDCERKLNNYKEFKTIGN